MAAVRLREIVDLVRGDCSGNLDLEIRGAKTLADATPEDISFLGNPKYAGQLATTRAGAVLVPRKLAGEAPNLVRVDDPYVALAQILKCWFAAVPGPAVGVSPRAQVAPSARLGRNVAIGAFVVVGENAVIGDGSLLYANVSVYHRSKIGRRCIVHSGAVIGSDGFGFATVGGVHQKIPQIGIVRIEDDVEIGACTTIDRAALGETVIGEGTKIDNLVQVGHNVRIGKHCFLVAMVGIAGSSEIGDHCILAGQAGMAGHIKLGSGVVVAAQSAVMKDWEGPIQIAGSPARPVREKLRADASLARLPRVLEQMRALERRIAELETKLAERGE